MFRKLSRNKRGIEVAVNFIVMLILAVATLAGSMILITKFFKGATDTKMAIDSQTESQIKSLLVGGAKVAIPVNSVTAHRRDFVTFGVGILDVLNSAGGQDTFAVTTSACTAKVGTNSYTIPPRVSAVQNFVVKNNEQKIFLVGYDISNAAVRATYICNIKVQVNGRDYAESVYKAYIKVE